MLQDLMVFGLGALLGTLVGHRFALGRDRRREFNDAARPIRDWLLRELDHVGSRQPSRIELDEFESRLRWRHRRRFRYWRDCYKARRREQQRQDSAGGIYYADEEPIREAVRKMLSCTERR